MHFTARMERMGEEYRTLNWRTMGRDDEEPSDSRPVYRCTERLRFVLRTDPDGVVRKTLQQAWQNLTDGSQEWRDVPLVVEQE